MVIVRWGFLPTSYDDLDFSLSDFLWIMIPFIFFILLWQLVIDKWLKKRENRKGKMSKNSIINLVGLKITLITAYFGLKYLGLTFVFIIPVLFVFFILVKYVQSKRNNHQ